MPTMNLHVEEVPCPCPWCRRAPSASLHRIRRMWFDDKPPSAEVQAVMDRIVKDALESASRTGAERV